MRVAQPTTLFLQPLGDVGRSAADVGLAAVDVTLEAVDVGAPWAALGMSDGKSR